MPPALKNTSFQILLTAATTLVLVAGAFFTLRSKVEAQEEHVRAQDARIDRVEIVQKESNAARETEYREIIQRLTRMETKLDRQ